MDLATGESWRRLHEHPSTKAETRPDLRMIMEGVEFLEPRLHDGAWETVVHDPRLLWPNTMSAAADGYLYVTADQLVGVVLVLRHVHRCGAVVVAGALGRAWLGVRAGVDGDLVVGQHPRVVAQLPKKCRNQISSRPCSFADAASILSKIMRVGMLPITTSGSLRCRQTVMPIHAAKLHKVSDRRRSARARVSTVSVTIG